MNWIELNSDTSKHSCALKTQIIANLIAKSHENNTSIPPNLNFYNLIVNFLCTDFKHTWTDAPEAFTAFPADSLFLSFMTEDGFSD